VHVLCDNCGEPYLLPPGEDPAGTWGAVAFGLIGILLGLYVDAKRMRRLRTEPPRKETQRRLIEARQSFFVVVRGPACALLRPRISGGTFVDPTRLVLVPKLHPVALVQQFASIHGMPVLVEEHEDMIGLWVGAVPRA